MTHALTRSLREAPTTIPALGAILLLFAWATSQAGYPLTHWAPGALIVLALLAIALIAVPVRSAEIPTSVKLAVACLALYTALSFLSIAWASDPGVAWEGANRTLLYLLVFALFALWRGRGASAALLTCLWTLALIGLAIYVAIRLDSATGTGFQALFAGERLSYPVGYPNATAAQWLIAFWPALLLARERRLWWGLRGLLAGGAVVLADLALLSQSRGSLYSLPIVVVLVFAFIPQRLRTFATAIPVALGIGITAPLLLRIGDHIQHGQNPYAATHSALAGMFAAALLVGLLVAALSALESRNVLSATFTRNVHRGLAALASLTLIAVLAGGLTLAGNPLTRVRHSWESFEGGYSKATTPSNRLLSGLGSNRYDFYRVALDEFLAHPVVGIGADNFSQQYLAHGRSHETPRYPHSVELRTLTQTGLLGALLALVGLGAALAAAWRALRGADLLARGVAAAALSGFAYWVIHGSFDWFWEFAGLGASAFALLGIVCSLAPRSSSPPSDSAPGTPASSASGISAPGIPVSGDAESGVSASSKTARPRFAARRGAAMAGAGLLAALLALLSLAAPWLSERQIQSAAQIWPTAPLTAYSRLQRAAELNPLSDRAYLVAGSIALRFGDLARAEHDFSLARQRIPNDAYATLELGAIASEAGQRTRALGLLARAVHLNPHDPLTRQALRTARSGKRVDVEALNRSILIRAQQLA